LPVRLSSYFFNAKFLHGKPMNTDFGGAFNRFSSASLDRLISQGLSIHAGLVENIARLR